MGICVRVNPNSLWRINIDVCSIEKTTVRVPNENQYINDQSIIHRLHQNRIWPYHQYFTFVFHKAFCHTTFADAMHHYCDDIMSTMAFQITGVSIVCSTVCSDAYQRKLKSSASLAFVRGIHRWPVNSPHKGPVTRKCFHLMTSSYVTAVHFLLCPYFWLNGCHMRMSDVGRYLPGKYLTYRLDI